MKWRLWKLGYIKVGNMDVFVVIENNVPSTPILVEDGTTADAVFYNIAEELVGEDISEIRFGSDFQLEDLRYLLLGSGKDVSVHWFIDIEVNNYVNE